MLTETHMRCLLWRHCQISLCTANLFFKLTLLFEYTRERNLWTECMQQTSINPYQM